MDVYLNSGEFPTVLSIHNPFYINQIFLLLLIIKYDCPGIPIEQWLVCKYNVSISCAVFLRQLN